MRCRRAGAAPPRRRCGSSRPRWRFVCRRSPATSSPRPGAPDGAVRAGYAGQPGSRSAGFGTFHRCTAGRPCSLPSRHGLAGPSTNIPPPDTGRPSHRATSTRLKWPCPTATTGPSASASRTRSSTRSARAPTCSAVSPPGGSPVQIVQSGRLARICGVVTPSYSPYAHSARSSSTSTVHRSPSPARSAVRWARVRGLVNTVAGQTPASSGDSARACFSPVGVSGTSVTLVCRPLRDHSVSPCRTRQNSPGAGAAGTGSVPAASRRLMRRSYPSGLLRLPEDLVDLRDQLQQLVRLGRVDLALAAGRAGLLGGVVEQLVQLRVLLEVRCLEVVGPQHPQVVLDQLRTLLLDDQGPGTEHRVLVLLVLLHDGLDRLSLDASLRGVVDAAGQVAVRVRDGARSEKPGQPHRGNLRIAAMIGRCRPYLAGPSGGSSWWGRPWPLPSGTVMHSWSARARRCGPATSSSPGSRPAPSTWWSSGRSARPGPAGGWRATTRWSPTTAGRTGRPRSSAVSWSATGRPAGAERGYGRTRASTRCTKSRSSAGASSSEASRSDQRSEA